MKGENYIIRNFWVILLMILAELWQKSYVVIYRGMYAGWMQCHYRLQFDAQGYPRLYVFDNCRDFIRTVPSLQFAKGSAEDLDSEGEDHAADEWRYACMSRPVVPVRETPPLPASLMKDPLERS